MSEAQGRASQLRGWLATPVGRGYAMAVVATATVGFAMAAQQNIVANYYEDTLKFGGSEFGYITAIREIPGFFLIFLAALFYRLSLPKLTAGALVLLTVGYGLFGASNSFLTVVPWVIISSMGYHTWLQTQPALGMSLTTEQKSGSILGRLSAINNAGAFGAMLLVLITFHFGWLSYRATFAICGVLAFAGAVAIFRFPHLHNGQVQKQAMKRAPLVWNREFRYYYLLSLSDGCRQQLFFAFGLWVLVSHFSLDVPVISGVLLVTSTIGMLAAPIFGRMLDAYGERRVLAIINITYVVTLLGYALIDNVASAIFFYVMYSFIFPLSPIGAATYLRKIAPSDEMAPSLAMGVTMQHASALIVPVAAGFILNYVGYQVPFLIACVFAVTTFFLTRRLAPEHQKSRRRLAEDAAQAGGTAATSITEFVESSSVELTEELPGRA